MAQTAESSLEARIAGLERTVRSLLAGAATAGTATAAETPGPVTVTGTASTVGSVPWDATQGPAVDLLVTGARIRVDVAASLEVYGNKASLFIGAQVAGPAVDQALLDDTTPVVRAPDYSRAASLQDDGVGMNQLGAFGTFDLVTGLEPGWYRVRTAYALTYSSTTGAPYGIATARRVSVTRY